MFRIGQSQDIHRLKEGRKLKLCGVEIPFSMGLDGHSDADVALHALTEAILGALALGDLGTFFPDTDMQYKDADSSIFLLFAMKKMQEMQYKISNIDLTILAEMPKLAPYLFQMRENISNWCQIEMEKVSIKAGTKEGMDAVGKKEAIEAHCVILLFSDVK